MVFGSRRAPQHPRWSSSVRVQTCPPPSWDRDMARSAVQTVQQARRRRGGQNKKVKDAEEEKNKRNRMSGTFVKI